MIHPPRSADTASWLVLAMMAIATVGSIRGRGFGVDGPRAVPLCLGLVVLVAGVCVGKRRRQARLAAGATAFLQMTLFAVLAVTLAYALAARGAPLWDTALAAADARLGLRWPAIFSAADRAPAALWLGGVAYGSLTTQMIVCIVALSATGRVDELRRAVAAALISGAVTVLLSGVMPAAGNLFDPAGFRHLSPSIAWQERGLIEGLRDGTGRVLDFSRLMGIVSFPSYHATLPVILAWALRDVRGLRIAAPAWAVVTIVATPIFGGHYGVDVLGGLALAVIAIVFAPVVVTRKAIEPEGDRRRDGAGQGSLCLPPPRRIRCAERAGAAPLAP
jgi:hypothetical protein